MKQAQIKIYRYGFITKKKKISNLADTLVGGTQKYADTNISISVLTKLKSPRTYVLLYRMDFIALTSVSEVISSYSKSLPIPKITIFITLVD